MEKCRLCYSNTTPQLSRNIFNTKLEPSICRTIKQLSNLIIEKNDPYTKLICWQCYDQFEQINLFRQTILNTDYRIRYEQGELSNRLSDNCDNSTVYHLPIKSESIDYELKEEPIDFDDEEDEEDEDPLNFDRNHDKIERDNTDKDLLISLDTVDNNNTTNIDRNRNGLPIKSEPVDDDLKEEPIEIEENSLKLENDTTNSNNSPSKHPHYQCNICKKTFRCKGSFIRHSTVHTGEKPYACDFCQRKFAQIGNLQRHLKLHTGIKQYHCTSCNRQFADKNHLIVHMRIHTGEKPYKCEICQQRFRHLSSFKIHSVAHTGEKPYKCQICDRSFAQKPSLKHHLRLHSGERPYQCHYCDKKYVQNSSLQNHYKRVHTS